MNLPPLHEPGELERQSDAALREFVRKRIAEGTAPYQEAFLNARSKVKQLFDGTDNLRRFTAQTALESPDLLDAARFLAGPPLSKDDLDTLSGSKISKRKNIDLQAAERAVEIVRGFFDPFRCPWLSDQSAPSITEIESAINWTSSIWAIQKCRTERRSTSSAEQEKQVADLLLQCGLTEKRAVRQIHSLDELPRRHFTRETILDKAKADLTIRLNDGRLLAIECKVSNSAVNSVKRLNRETVGKAENWRANYGRQVITCAVLAGVFKVSNLIDAQQAGVHIFWEHDLLSLERFVLDATKCPEARSG